MDIFGKYREKLNVFRKVRACSMQVLDEMIPGLCAMLDNHYPVFSNREAGNRRYE